MLLFSLVHRCAVRASCKALTATTVTTALSPGSTATLQGASSSAAPASGRTEAIERLSNEVFGRGNQHLKNVETLASLPEGLQSFPEVCFIGKPNCGKSSLISCLLHNRRLGKAGATGGTTRLLQFFNVGDALLLVDTPGYGGWRGRQLAQPLATQANAFAILFRYLALRNGSNLKRVYWLMEASARTPMSFQPRDEELLSFLARERIPFSVVLTKNDRHWRHCAEMQRKTDLVRKDGLVHPPVPQPEGEEGGVPHVARPEDGVERNVREVFDFLGTDAVPVLGVSANRLQPDRSRNLELLQHDLVHYCVQDLAPSEELSFRNLHRLSYAPPAADRIQEVQLRYPVEAFVVPRDNNMSLARMVERHEAAKAHYLANSQSAQHLTAKDVAVCHLGSVAKLQAVAASDREEQERIAEVLPATTFLYDAASSSALTAVLPATSAASQDTTAAQESLLRARNRLAADAVPGRSEADAERGHSPVACDVAKRAGARLAVAEALRSFRARPSLSAASQREDASLSAALDEAWNAGLSEGGEDGCALAAVPDRTTTAVVPPLLPTPLPPGLLADASPQYRPNAVVLQERRLTLLALPTLLDPEAHYVAAVDGTLIPRSMISLSVEQLAVSKEDELAHFATKSGAGAYEELLLLDHNAGGADADLFTETSNLARLPEEAQMRLFEARQYRTRSAARQQEKRLLAKYLERRRKERSVDMQAEGYMCPWLGQSGSRSAVHGVAASHSGTGQGGAVMRDLKASGFGGKSFSARTARHNGRATKKTGFWAA